MISLIILGVNPGYGQSVPPLLAFYFGLSKLYTEHRQAALRCYNHFFALHTVFHIPCGFKDLKHF